MRTIIFGLVILAVTGQFSAASAQTVGFADAVAILSKACGNDIARHCKNTPMERIGICLDKNTSKVSGTCQKARVQVWTLLDIRAAAQASAEKTCGSDIAHYCKGVVRAKGHRLRCLLKAQKRISKKCNKILLDAGYKG